MNDFIGMVIDRAIDRFGGKRDSVFNAAGFSSALREMSGVKQTIDGGMVRAILCGRRDVDVLAGGCHYRKTESKGG